MEKKELLYEGKAKKVWTTEDASLVVIQFKDDATAFDGAKKGKIAGKGEINCAMSSLLFEYLESFHVPTHFVKRLGPADMLARKVSIVKVEAVMRNIATGSLVKRLALPEGKVLDYPIFETYYKDDALGDPLINEYHAYTLGVAKPEDIQKMFRMTQKVNAVLKAFFDRRGMTLVDFKLEFGRWGEDDLILADEISPDTCRIWDKKTGKKLDKDRFRLDLGGVEGAYKEVLQRIS